jgi:magnesium chelatase family protein
MSLAVTHSRAKLGIDAPAISVEVHLSNGLPVFNIVGLPETSVKESKDRVRSAIINSHFDFPARRITVNLAPADIPKQGSRFDLAIAIAILAASNQVPNEKLSDYEFISELALTGDLRSVQAVLPSALRCAEDKRRLIVAMPNANEAALVEHLSVLPASHLLQVSAHLHHRELIPPCSRNHSHNQYLGEQLSDVLGQNHAKRALTIAAAGGHHTLLYGPPGTGKTMLASRLRGILPPLSNKEAMTVASIYSAAGKGLREHIDSRPFRSPHHTASAVALVGGGSVPKPGEISLAHEGVLFLDELPEFSRHVLEVLREPLESGKIMISRISAQTSYPARFQLIAAMNPCPCGYLGTAKCECTTTQISRYRQKLSGPLLDRIDLKVHVDSVESETLFKRPLTGQGESDEVIQKRICTARKQQSDRQGKLNCDLNSREILKVCPLSSEHQRFFDLAIEKFTLSTRGFYRTLKVARTIADLQSVRTPSMEHYHEALSYRQSMSNKS